jgi:hypothetical protein
MREGNITQSTTGYFQLASGSSAQRPGTPTNGMMRYNTDASAFEFFQGGSWLGFTANTATAVAALTSAKLTTARAIAHSGDVTGSASFDGTGDITIPLTLANSGITAGTYMFGTVTYDAKGRATAATSYALSADFSTVSATVNLSNTGVTAGTYAALASQAPILTIDSRGRITNASTMAISIPSANITDATAANTASTIVKRDASGNFVAGTITAALAGNASTASKLAAAVTIAHSGDATGSVAFDGSTGITIPLTLAASGATAGTYALATITVDAKGRVTAASAGTAYTGTTNQTTVSGTNVIGLASDLTIPGNAGFLPPIGTTAQRASAPSVGQTRFNTDVGRMETWDGSDWIQPLATTTANTSVQYASAGIVTGAALTSIEPGGNLWLRQSSTTTVSPAIPADGLVLFADTRGGSTLPAVQAASGMWNRLQQAFSTKRVTLWQAQGGTTNVSAIGGAMLITVGASTTAVTGTAQTNASTNYFTSMRRLRLSTAATAGAIISIRSSGGQQFFRGNGTAGIGGFDLVMHFGVAAVPAATSCRWGAGLFSTTAALTNVDISTLQNMCCFGANAADSNMSFFYNATSTTASSVSLGANFPAKSVSTDFYQARIYTPPNGAFIGYSIINLTTGAQTSGTVTTTIPANTTMLCPQIAMITTVATTASIDVQQILIETESY